MSLKLDLDEKIIYEAGLSFWLFMPSLVVLSSTLFGAAFLFFADPIFNQQRLLMMICVVVFGMTGLRLFTIFASTSIILTTRRVVFAKGFLQRHVEELYLTRVEGVNIRQSLNARLMGYGTVEASGVGSEIAPIAGIANPWVFHKSISEAMYNAMAVDPMGGGNVPARPQAPQAPQVPQVPQPPQAPQVPQAPQAPEMPQTAEAPPPPPQTPVKRGIFWRKD